MYSRIKRITKHNKDHDRFIFLNFYLKLKKGIPFVSLNSFLDTLTCIVKEKKLNSYFISIKKRLIFINIFLIRIPLQYHKLGIVIVYATYFSLLCNFNENYSC